MGGEEGVDERDDGRTFSRAFVAMRSPTTHFSLKKANRHRPNPRSQADQLSTQLKQVNQGEDLSNPLICHRCAAMASSPDSIECSAQPFDLSFHPQRQHLVAAALVDGTVEVHDFSSPPTEDDENDTIVSSIAVHPQLGSKNVSCRTVRFSDDGGRIYAGTSAGDVCAFDAERACTLSATTTTTTTPGMLWKLSTGSHGIHVMHQLGPEYRGMLVTGDEQGCVSLWDERSPVAGQKPVLTWNENEDYISGLDYHDHLLFASCADCTLSVFDLRKATTDTSKRAAESLRRSDDQEDELLSVKVMKHGKKVVCGTQEGVLAVWSWGTWGDISDRFPGHPSSIDALCKVDEDTLLTGSSDGLVRLVQIHPDKLIGVLGDHDGYPIERLEFNSTRSFVGSVSHDPFIRLWDARVLQEHGDDDGDESEEEANVKMAGATRLAPSKPVAVGHASDDEWDEDDDDEEEDAVKGGSDDSDDSSDDSDDEKETANDRRAKRMKTENEKFFDDL
jgi:WD40 repeat protein